MFDLAGIRRIEMKGGDEAGPIVKVRVTALDGTQVSFVGPEAGRKVLISENDGIYRYDFEFVDFVRGGWEDDT